MDSRGFPGADVVGSMNRADWPPVTYAAPIRAHEVVALMGRFRELIADRVAISMGACGDGRDVVAELVDEAAALVVRPVVDADGRVFRAAHPRGAVAVLCAEAERVGMDPYEIPEWLRARAWSVYDELRNLGRCA